jgi:ankyrin repeat protein
LGLAENEVDVPDEQGYRASHYAAIKGYNLCLARLLDAGANPNALDVNMKSPVNYGEFLANDRLLRVSYYVHFCS